MEQKVTLGLFASGEGHKVALITKNGQEQLDSSEKNSDKLAFSVMQLLKKHGLSCKDLEVLVVGVGPGSFTGSRVAVSFAKGLACALPQLKLVPFTTFDFYGFKKQIDMVLVPAFSSLVYVSKKGQLSCKSKEEFKNVQGAVVADKVAAEMCGICTYEAPNTDFIGFVRHMSNGAGVNVENLTPLYLRASQAEIEREKKEKKSAT